MHKDKEVVISLGKAGAPTTASSRGATTGKPRKPAGPWGDTTLAMVVSLYRDKHGRYQPKPMALVVKAAAGGGGAGATKPLATFKFDAAHFASAAGTKEACDLRSVNAKDDGRLGADIACIFLRQSDGTSGSEASSVASTSVIEERGEEEEEEGEKGEGQQGSPGRASDQDLSGFEDSVARRCVLV